MASLKLRPISLRKPRYRDAKGRFRQMTAVEFIEWWRFCTEIQACQAMTIMAADEINPR